MESKRKRASRLYYKIWSTLILFHLFISGLLLTRAALVTALLRVTKTILRFSLKAHNYPQWKDSNGKYESCLGNMVLRKESITLSRNAGLNDWRSWEYLVIQDRVPAQRDRTHTWTNVKQMRTWPLWAGRKNKIINCFLSRTSHSRRRKFYRSVGTQTTGRSIWNDN